jgi:isoleucyl-tRNA synthetase|tara:strand:+ start:94 stop:561 length:468 start_codon:yes stop_codon:yes gene_type:complete
MEEVWLERSDDVDSSIHLNDFPETPSTWENPELAKKWSTIRKVRKVVTGALELKRQDKSIGASLEAAPFIHVNEETKKILESVSFEDICITSAVKITTDLAPKDAFVLDEVTDVAVIFERAQGNKCQRCWKVLPEVGDPMTSAICSRCKEALGDV